MVNNRDAYELELLSVDSQPEGPGVDRVVLNTDRGTIDCRLHPVELPDAAVIWVGGAGGGLSGPAGGMYPRLASQLAGEGIGSLRVDYRFPNHLTACTLDTLMGSAFLQALGYKRLILTGHSFGGAVVIAAGAQDPAVIGVIGLASQTAGTELTTELNPRAVLLLHGDADTVLPVACSQDIHSRAEQPKEIVIYPGCGHGFDECRPEVDEKVLSWIRGVVNNQQ